MYNVSLTHSCLYVTCSHEIDLNFNLGNLSYVRVSNLQVMLVILIFKSRLYSKNKKIK